MEHDFIPRQEQDLQKCPSTRLALKPESISLSDVQHVHSCVSEAESDVSYPQVCHDNEPGKANASRQLWTSHQPIQRPEVRTLVTCQEARSLNNGVSSCQATWACSGAILKKQGHRTRSELRINDRRARTTTRSMHTLDMKLEVSGLVMVMVRASRNGPWSLVLVGAWREQTASGETGAFWSSIRPQERHPFQHFGHGSAPRGAMTSH